MHTQEVEIEATKTCHYKQNYKSNYTYLRIHTRTQQLMEVWLPLVSKHRYVIKAQITFTK